MPSLRTMSRKRVWTLGVVVALLMALAVALVLWMRSDGHRVNATLGDVEGVESVELDDEPDSPASQALLVEIDDRAGREELESILAMTEDVLDEELATSAFVSVGDARVRVDSRTEYRADARDAARFLGAFRAMDDGRATLDWEDLTVDHASRPVIANVGAWLAAIEKEELAVRKVLIDGEDFNIISIHRPRSNHRDVLESLRDWDQAIEQIRLEENGLTLRARLPLAGLGPLVEVAQDSARSLDPESPGVTVETVDGLELRLGNEDPSDALAASVTLEKSGWAVERINGKLTALDVSAADGAGSDAAALPDLVDALEETELSRDAEVRVDEGRLFWGKKTDLDALAPAIARAQSEGYAVSWTSDGRSPGPADVRVFVEMPEGHSLAEDSQLAAAIEVARSVPWEGTGSITVRTTSSDGLDDQEAVTVESTARGEAKEVTAGPRSSVDEGRVREAWDVTAGDD